MTSTRQPSSAQRLLTALYAVYCLPEPYGLTEAGVSEFRKSKEIIIDRLKRGLRTKNYVQVDGDWFYLPAVRKLRHLRQA